MNTKVFKLLLSFILLSVSLQAQITKQPISWSYNLVNESGNVLRIEIKGVIDPSRSEWHIYGLGPYDNGPTPTTLIVESLSGDKKDIELLGKTSLLTPEKVKFDEMFQMEIGICEDKVVLGQKVKVLSADSVSVRAIVEWQACDDQSCLPPTEKEFIIKLPGTGKVSVNAAKSVPIVQSPIVPSKDSILKTESEPAVQTSEELVAPSEIQADTAESSEKSIWGVIIEAIIWGFVALLTPCVFPMVPMTVSFFLKQSQESQSKRASRGRVMASFFGLSIVALYTLPIAAIIFITYFAGGEAVTADIFNWLATHWVPNVLFFLIFMIFAASFFGAFEIVLPSWLVNKSDSKSDRGGYAGVFFMALTLVLVSFSCTGPIVGTILIKSTQGEIWEPIITMLAFSAAFALPFTIFAFAPSLLKDLPKSGGWLNSVKVVLGFIEVALGFKFLSVADQVYHWGLLDREIYLAIWIVVFTMLGFYLLGKLRFSHDSPQEHITVKRLALSIITFSFVVYMIPGMWGAPLKGLSGYLPPMSTQDFRQSEGGRGDNNTNSVTNEKSESLGFAPLYSDFLHMPHGLEGFFRYQEGLEYAKKVGKPVFIDFTGHGCVNCREMEARVWSDPRVLEILKEKFVIIALYADDKKEAVKGDWITTESGRVLKSIGKINTHLAMTKYSVNAQPYYAIINPHTEEHLTEPRGYNLDTEAFIKFLEKGSGSI